MQEAIINMISGGEGEGPHVFMVGDVKQSIYRFRQARPELFMTKYNTYPSGKGHPFRKILLAKISGVAGGNRLGKSPVPQDNVGCGW